jgi:hypothetical protein
MFDAKSIVEDQARMKATRQPFEQMQRECSELLLPRQSGFDNLGGYGTPQNLESRVFDEYAQQALEQGVSIFEGYVIPRGQIWQRWELADEDLMKLQHVREWSERKNMQLFRLRNDPKSGFTGQVHESVASLFAFGMQSMWVDLRRDIVGNVQGFSYQSEFIGEIFVKEDHQGLVSLVHRMFRMKAHQAFSKWGERSPPCVKKAMEGNKNPDECFEFIHRIEPNREFDGDRIDEKGKPWRGCYFCVSDNLIFETGGYHSMPRTVSRFINAPNEEYGRCPAFTILPAIRATQQMMLDLMAASELAAMPPLGAHDDMQDQTVRYAAREITYGAVDSRGNRRLVPLLEAADMTMAMQLLDKLHGHIDRAFFVDMLQIRQDMKSHVTDSQLYQREEEKGILLSPLANQETEWFSVMLDRELSLMDEAGMMDDMPGEVAEAMDAGIGMRVIYDNGLSRAQEAGAAAGYFRMLEQFTPIFQTDPSALKTFQQKYPFDKVLNNLGRINGVPAAWEATDDERKALKDIDASAQESASALEAAPILSKVANDLNGLVPANAA